jgi:hypothetical protein
MSVQRTRAVAVALVAAIAGSCATSQAISGNQLSRATIEVYRDKDDQCHTKTTPFFKIRKSGKATWTIRDETRCLAASDAVVEISFADKGETDPLAATCARRNKRKIECRINTNADPRIYKYSVIITGSKEDPEIEIEMP